ncbi:MAG: mechanosensitive ion channel family protein, partial [Dehalococcoidia bacterium]
MIRADMVLWGNPLDRWLVALVIAAAAGLVLYVVTWVLRRRLARSHDRRHAAVTELLVDLAVSVKTPLLLPIALVIGERTLSLPSEVHLVLRTVMLLGLMLQGVIWAEHVIAFAANRYQATREDDRARADSAATIAIFVLLARLVLWALLFLLVLDNLGIDVTAVVAGLGIGGIAVALALQNILGDLFSSLSIMIDRPFVVGDFIIVGDAMGTVEHVGMKTTRVRSLSGEQLIFSNADILQSRIRNYQRLQERRVLFTLGVVYQTPHEVLAAIPKMLREIVESQEQVRFDRAHFARYADSALEFEVVYYVLLADYNRYMDIQQGINLEVFRRFGEAGIDFAYPSRTLFVQHADAPD